MTQRPAGHSLKSDCGEEKSSRARTKPARRIESESAATPTASIPAGSSRRLLDEQLEGGGKVEEKREKKERGRVSKRVHLFFAPQTRRPPRSVKSEPNRAASGPPAWTRVMIEEPDEWKRAKNARFSANKRHPQRRVHADQANKKREAREEINGRPHDSTWRQKPDEIRASSPFALMKRKNRKVNRQET